MDPTNIRIEQCFGELKFLEHKFERLTILNLLGKVNYQFHFDSISFKHLPQPNQINLTNGLKPALERLF